MQKPKRSKSSARDWVAEAKRLRDVKQTEAWRTTHRSFSAWLRDDARRQGIQPSVLWRDLGAFEFYYSLGSDYGGLPLPSIEEAGAIVSPQHLEVIEKLSQSADRSSIREMLRRALLGELTRSELLETWRIHKSKEHLTPRRGRGVSEQVRVQRANARAAESSVAMAMVRLMQATPAWTGYLNPTLFRAMAGPSHRGPDIIAICKPAPDQPVAVHGLEIKVLRSIASIARIHHELARLLSAVVSSFDYFWLAVATDVPLGATQAQKLLAGLPVETGLLEVRGAHIRLVRAAQLREGAKSSEILAELLALK